MEKPTTKLEQKIIERLTNFGADVRNYGNKKERLYTIMFQQNSSAHLEYIEYCREFDQAAIIHDPVVNTILPVAADGEVPALATSLMVKVNLLLTTQCQISNKLNPSNDEYSLTFFFKIQAEANAVIIAYASLSCAPGTLNNL